MASPQGLPKSALSINFAQGLDTKSDPFQIAPGRFLKLQNSVFETGQSLVKRNGFGALAALPDATSTYLTTFNGNLTAIGTAFNAFADATDTWVNKGSIRPVRLEVLSAIRNNTNQTYADSAVASNGLICVAYTDNVPVAGANTLVYKYAVIDGTTGQNIVAPTVITSNGTITYAPKVFFLGRYFIIVFDTVVTATNHLQYIAINIINPSQVTTPADISTQYAAASTGTFDGAVANNTLFLAWAGTSTTVKAVTLSSTLTLGIETTFTSTAATHMSVCLDTTGNTPIMWAAFYNSGGTAAAIVALTPSAGGALNTLLAKTAIFTSTTAKNITCAAQNGVCSVFWEVDNAYSYDSSIKTNFIRTRTVTNAGTLGSITIPVRGVGLYSRAFIVDSVVYFTAAYSSTDQPTYFVINSSGKVITKFAYSNGGGYSVTGLTNATVIGSTVRIAYLIKDMVEPVSRSQAANTSAGAATSTPSYAQTGVNIASVEFTSDALVSSEIGKNLHVSGGFLWMYDGYVPVEHGFFLYPDSLKVTTGTTSGSVADGTYYYQAIYEWADNQGNIHRSAPSLPVKIVTTGGNTSTNTVNVPYLRLTYKTANPIKISIFRWSTAQPIYYKVTSVALPVLNDTTADSVAFSDTLADSSILGGAILYTTGGVIENIAAPATQAMALFQSRLFLVNAEDPDQLWFSKQVIEGTPVEMSDLLTIFVAPTTGAQGSTGATKVVSAMDDKLVLFKKDAAYYITGAGPDNTGANNGYSEPQFITATVGCDNPQSVVMIPNGLMFQSDKGIWLLGRDLSTQYIGAPVEMYNDNVVLAAVNVPGTNQVRFTLDNGVTLMYDYYFGQWGTFTNVPAISSTLYEGLHTYINSSGAVFQETPGIYLDGGNPVLMSFKTGWFNLTGVQGFERAYFFSLLGVYISPHILNVKISYDYAQSPSQIVPITPDNFNYPWGGEQLYGSGEVYGGNTQLEQWEIFFDQQKLQAFQIEIDEIFDASYGVAAGAGFTLSGLNLVVAAKGKYPRLKAANQAG